MARAEPKNESAAGKLLNRCGFISEQIGMPQIDIRDRGAKFDSLGIESERKRTRQRIVVRLGHENAGESRILGRPRPFDKPTRWTIGKYCARKCDIGHDWNSFLF